MSRYHCKHNNNNEQINMIAQIRLASTIILLAILSFFKPSFSAPSTENGEAHYNSIGAFSTYQLEIGLDNLYSEFTRTSSLKYGFFTKDKVLNTMILVKKYPNASLDLLFPGVVIMGICFSAPNNEACGCAQDVANILNGEIGYKFDKFAISLANGLHPFVSDGFYHDSGVKLSLGGKHEFSGYAYEQDLLGRDGIDYGISFSYTYYGVPDAFNTR